MFRDRAEGGRQLAVQLEPLLKGKRAVIVGLARGGVATARAVADALHQPLDVACPRKIGAPGYAELAVGAVTESGQPIWNEELVEQLQLGDAWRAHAAAEQAQEARRRLDRFRKGMAPRHWKGHIVVLVDDGLATGATMRAAIQGARSEGAEAIWVAVPVSPPATCERLRSECDRILCLATPQDFQAVGQFYDQFEQVEDQEVLRLLQGPVSAVNPAQDALLKEVLIPLTVGKARGQSILGNLTVPAGASSLVLFVHGSGSSRKSPRNEKVARALQSRGMATLLVDLLSEQEAAQDEDTGVLRFDVDLLSSRVLEAVRWLKTDPLTRQMAIGLYGASTGAAAALIAAAALGKIIFAVVSRGGRPDLAGEALASVSAPTLLIVGGEDHEVLSLNRIALEQLRCPKRLTIIPGATHLFEEPGTLEKAAQAALNWFEETQPSPAA